MTDWEYRPIEDAPDEPLWYLKSLPYRSYLGTLHWKRLAERIKNERDRACEVCGFYLVDRYVVMVEMIPHCEVVKRDGETCGRLALDNWSTCGWHKAQGREFWFDRTGRDVDRRPTFVVHHLTYERLGEELDEDLLVTCLQCNFTISYPDSNAGRYWFACPEGSTVALAEKQARLINLIRLERRQRRDPEVVVPD